jgi:hypothetical protein
MSVKSVLTYLQHAKAMYRTAIEKAPYDSQMMEMCVHCIKKSYDSYVSIRTQDRDEELGKNMSEMLYVAAVVCNIEQGDVGSTWCIVMFLPRQLNDLSTVVFDKIHGLVRELCTSSTSDESSHRNKKLKSDLVRLRSFAVLQSERHRCYNNRTYVHPSIHTCCKQKRNEVIEYVLEIYLLLF